MKGQFRLTKKERIAHPQELRRVMRTGKRSNSRHFTLFYLENGIGYHRLGVVVKKEIGSATYRNRIKRYCREFFRLHKLLKKGSFDFVVLVKKGDPLKHYREVEGELRCLFLLQKKGTSLA